MFRNFLVLFVICNIAVSNASRRRKRQVTFTNPWAQMGQAFAGAFAGPFVPFAIPVPVVNTGSSVSTSTSSQQYPTFNSPSSFPSIPPIQWAPFPPFQPFQPFRPFPPMTFNFPTPWYRGDNVCVETRYSDEPDAFRGFGDISVQGSHGSRSESCTGNSDVYICRGRKTVMENGRAINKEYMTKYQCCYGFVRPNDGSPGCIESKQYVQPAATNTQTAAHAQSAGVANAQSAEAANAQSVRVANAHSAGVATAQSGGAASAQSVRVANAQSGGAASAQSAVATGSNTATNSNSYVVQQAGAVAVQ